MEWSRASLCIVLQLLGLLDIPQSSTPPENKSCGKNYEQTKHPSVCQLNFINLLVIERIRTTLKIRQPNATKPKIPGADKILLLTSTDTIRD